MVYETVKKQGPQRLSSMQPSSFTKVGQKLMAPTSRLPLRYSKLAYNEFITELAMLYSSQYC